MQQCNSLSLSSETQRRVRIATAESETLKQLARESLVGIDIDQQIQETKQGLRRQLGGLQADVKGLAGSVAIELHGALTAQSKWEDSNAHGWGKAGASVQRFATTLAKFMETFSGVIEVMKNAGAPYGAVGYQSLSVLLIVAVNKSKNDDFITNELASMVNCFPRINLLADIYPDKDIERYVLEVHTGVIQFARQATEYFLHKSKRVLKSLQPAENAVTGQADEVKRSLAELNAWSSVLLHQRTRELLEGQKELKSINNDLQSKMGDLKSDNTDLKTGLEELKTNNRDLENKLVGLALVNAELNRKIDEQNKQLTGLEGRDVAREVRADQEQLDAIHEALGRPDEKVNSNLTKVRHSLDESFPTASSTHKVASRYLQVSEDLLQSETEYRRWLDGDEGALLLLSGMTAREGQKILSGYSWLSPAAADMAERMRGQGDVIVAFYSCHPEWHVQPGNEPSMQEVVAGLIYQLVKQCPAIMKVNSQWRASALEIASWSRSKDKETMAAIFDATIDTLVTASAKKRVYLIVDRPDKCKAKLVLLLRWLRKVVHHPGCRVKVLVVWDTAKSSLAEEDWEDFMSERSERVYYKLGWDQVKPPFEKSALRKRFTEQVGNTDSSGSKDLSIRLWHSQETA